MTQLRKLVWVLLWALLYTSFSVSKAQVIDQTTGNLITNTWSGAPSSTTPPMGLSGGYEPTFNTETGTLQFGWAQGTASQAIGINAALTAAGVGIQVSGFNYSWNYFNQDLNRGTLSGTISLTNSAGSVLNTYNYSMPQTTNGWTNVSGTQNFLSPYTATSLGNLNVSFTGKDDRFWAGYYGPLVKDIDVRLKYSVDPCATNPAYSPSCAGFNSVITSSNVVPYPNASAAWGSVVNNGFAIQTALSEGGSGLKVHGFDWGYRVFSANPYCAFWLIVCFDDRDPLVRTTVSITSNTGASLYSVTRDYNDINTPQNFNYSYRFQSSANLGTLGNFNFSGQTWDYASIDSMYARILYTPDLCMIDPLSSPTCPKYFETLSRSTTTQPQQVGIQELSPVTQDVVALAAPASSTTTSNDSVPMQQTTSSPMLVSTSQTSSPSTSNSTTSTQNTSSSQSNSSSVSLTTILSIVRNEQARISTVETSTVQQANDVAALQSNDVQSQAEKIASTSSQTSQQQITPVAGGSGITFTQQSLSSTNNQSNQISNTENISLVGPSPMKDQIENTPRDETNTSSVNQEQRQVERKKVIRDNDAAGGVTIASIATQPVGFELYQLSIKDAPFYPPKEIYKGQQNVDNARLLRGLTGGSDKLHEQMIGSQYK